METEFTANLLLPLQQSPQYAGAISLMGASIESHAIGRKGTPVGWCQIQSRRMGFLGDVRMISRGPICQKNCSEIAINWLSEKCEEGRSRPFTINAETESLPLRRLGFWPIMTGATVAILPLQNSEAMRTRLTSKWRNRLAKAEGGPLSIRSHSFDGDLRAWLLSTEAQQRSQRGYSGFPPEFTVAFAQANPGCARIFTAYLNKAPVAAMLFLRHGRTASYHIGYARPEARQHNAHNLVMWHAMIWLSRNGHDQLDLGTVNTQDAAGLARFKLGTGADAKRLGGTWLYQKALAPIAKQLPERLAA